ncbi:SEC-C metal-binding domain-containing protein [Clostridium formicaceticum]|uniref:Zinc chelation protein SecC n=1 Tax=Clostridium formicaceticum TaxID=1497 RepID=A0AAC9RKK0_9CLOT|nr:SEC-C metal-binding domain-containing protein [Clostridium formicaceticum]AOY76306.1 hypothetical protein BJL90_10565 [Clostridium formicaceticum]ARE86693.1 hypothetical protein CLFO_10200 [Clostridium formicaceticum]
MREKTGDKIEEVLLQTMCEMQKGMAKQQVKRDNTLWKKISVPYTYKEMLTSLAKNELTEIRQNLRLQGISKLKKQPLIEVLNEKMLQNLPIILSKMDTGRYQLIKEIVNNEGVLYKFHLKRHEIEYYRSRGLIFTGIVEEKKVITAPEEFVKVLRDMADHQELLDKLERNEKWLRLTYGLLYYYGFLNINTLVNMVEKLLSSSINLTEYLEVIEDSMNYYRQITKVQEGYSHKKVSDVKKLKEQLKERTDLSYYPFSYDEIYEAGGIGFIDKNDGYERMAKLIKDHYNIMPKEAGSLVEECVYAIRTGESINNIVQFIQRHLEIPSFEMMKKFTEEIIYLNNNTRQWMIKGYTPEELSQRDKSQLKQIKTSDTGEVISMKTKKKIGRNDPCPCGSGKKFKKCCGQ